MPESIINAANEPLVTVDDAQKFAKAYANARENGLDCEFLTWYNAGIRQGLTLDAAAMEACVEFDLM